MVQLYTNHLPSRVNIYTFLFSSHPYFHPVFPGVIGSTPPLSSMLSFVLQQERQQHHEQLSNHGECRKLTA